MDSEVYVFGLLLRMLGLALLDSFPCLFPVNLSLAIVWPFCLVEGISPAPTLMGDLEQAFISVDCPKHEASGPSSKPKLLTTGSSPPASLSTGRDGAGSKHPRAATGR